MEFISHNGCSEVWRVVAALTLWKIWKSRNEVAVQGGNFNQETVIMMLKSESLCSLVNFNLISKAEANLWAMDPSAVVKRFESSKKASFMANLFKYFDKIAFSYGSWLISRDKGGMGGFVITKSFKIIYAFSGRLVFQMLCFGCRNESMQIYRPKIGSIKTTFKQCDLC